MNTVTIEEGTSVKAQGIQPPQAIRFQIADSAIGTVLTAATGNGVCAILLGDDAQELQDDLETRFPGAVLIAGDSDFKLLTARVLRFVEGTDLNADFPLDVSGTDFQERVWRALRDIEPGSTASYKDVAETIGSPKSVRAVARACAANPVAIAIPCHRVVRSDGGLSGYRWGIDRKRKLLGREAQR